MNIHNTPNRNSTPDQAGTTAGLVRIAGHMRDVIDAARLLMIATAEEDAARWVHGVLGQRSPGGPAAG